MRKRVPYTVGLIAIACGAATILGWLIESSFLKDPFRTNFTAPNTALCLIAAGLALLVQQQNITRWFWKLPSIALSGFVAAAGLLTTFEYLAKIDLGIDRLFLASKLNEWTAPNVMPGRIAPNTAVAILFAGLALLFPRARVEKFRVAELFAMPVLLVSFLGLMGYAYGAEPLYGIGGFSSMSLQTALFLGVLAIGILWSRADFGMTALILSDDAVGLAARRLLLATFITLPILGWIRVKVQGRAPFDPGLGTAVFVIASVVIFVFMIVQTAQILRDFDDKRRLAEESLKKSHAELESLVEKRTATLRHLSSRLMRVQDEEHRKIARELHDGLGQSLTALSLNLGRLEQQPSETPSILEESRGIITQAISETRTLSHLLHPPLLDEIGFASAAKWFVEGFSKRSGVAVALYLPEDLPRLPQYMEIGLFRILQEGLTNIHRHSGSPSADIHILLNQATLHMQIRDYGRGIPAEVLEKWRTSGAAGVGLGGMRERVSELGGQAEISNAPQGTLVSITVPVGTMEVGNKISA